MEKIPGPQSMRTLALVFMVCFLIRVLFVVETMNIPAFRTPNPGMDIDLHWQAARLLLEGATTKEPYFELMIPSRPFYQYWLAFWRLVLGDSLVIHRLFNAFLASFSAVLIFWLISRLLQNRLISYICAFLWITLPSLIYFDSTLHKSALEILCLLGLVYIALGRLSFSLKFGPFVNGAIAGILLVVLLSLQGNTFLYSVVILGFIALDQNLSRKPKTQMLASLILTFMTPLLFLQIRNQVASDGRYPWFLPVKGIHFYIGFHQGGPGTYNQVKDIKPWPYGHAFQSRLYAEAEMERPVTPEEADRFFIKKALDYIADNPRESIELIFSKFLLFFNNYEVKGIDDLYYLKTQSTVLALTPLGLGILVLFSGLGVVHLIRLKAYRILFLFGGLLGAMLISNISSFISWRYRLHNVVPLIVFTAYGLEALKVNTFQLTKPEAPFRSRLIRYGVVVFLPLILCGWLAYHPVLQGYRKRFFSRAAYNDKLSQRAERLQRKLNTLEGNATKRPELTIQKALLLASLHRHSEAYKFLKSIHEKQVYHPYGTLNYLVYLLWLGEYDQAIDLLRDVKTKRPDIVLHISKHLTGAEKKAYDIFVAPHMH